MVAADVTSVIRDRLVRALYQPIVDLEHGTVDAYEALARGPAGGDLVALGALFAAAGAAGLTRELDVLCAEVALEGALAADLDPELALFINVEAATIGGPLAPRLRSLVDEARGRLRVVIEITERSVAARPAELLQLVSSIRRHGPRRAERRGEPR